MVPLLLLVEQKLKILCRGYPKRKNNFLSATKAEEFLEDFQGKKRDRVFFICDAYPLADASGLCKL